MFKHPSATWVIDRLIDGLKWGKKQKVPLVAGTYCDYMTIDDDPERPWPYDEPLVYCGCLLTMAFCAAHQNFSLEDVHGFLNVQQIEQERLHPVYTWAVRQFGHRYAQLIVEVFDKTGDEHEVFSAIRKASIEPDNVGVYFVLGPEADLTECLCGPCAANVTDGLNDHTPHKTHIMKRHTFLAGQKPHSCNRCSTVFA